MTDFDQLFAHLKKSSSWYFQFFKYQCTHILKMHQKCIVGKVFNKLMVKQKPA